MTINRVLSCSMLKNLNELIGDDAFSAARH